MTGQLAVYREFGSLKAPVIRYMPEGSTLSEMRALMTCLPHDFDARGIICINGRPVYRSAWSAITPKVRHNGVPVEVTFHLPPMGGGGGDGGGKNVLAIVAGIALTALTGAVAGGSLVKWFGLGKTFAAGGIGATLAGAGVSLVGSLLLSALVPPPAIPTGKTIQNAGAASAEGNVLEPNGAIPRVVGERKVYPPLACEPITYFEGQDEIVEALYVLAGPHRIQDIRLGAATIVGLTNVEYEVREGWPGDARIDMVRRQSRTEPVQSELRGPIVDAETGIYLESVTGDVQSALPQPVMVATRDAPDEHWLHLIFPGGINKSASDSDFVRVPLRIRIRQIGTTTWINLPEMHFSAATQRQLRAAIKLKWVSDATATLDAATKEGFVSAHVSVPAQTQAPAVAAWSADAYFSAVSGDTWIEAGNLGTTCVRHLEMDRYTATVLLDSAVFPKDRYEIEIERGQQVLSANWSSSAYTVSGTVWSLFDYAEAKPRIAETRNGISDTVVLLRSVSVWNEHPLPLPGLATIAIRARNRAVDRVSCLAGGWVRDWDGTAWRNWVVTSNPAPHLHDIYGGWLNLDPVPEAIIDTATLLDWRTDCDALNFTVNALIEEQTVEDAARIVAACGYAKPYQSEIWGVVRDRDRSAEAPEQIFTPRNMQDFQWTKAFANLPEGFRVNFRDASRDYEMRQISVFRPGFSNDSGRMEQVTYEGIDTEAAARARAEYDLAQLELRSAVYSWKAPAEAIVCRRGSLIGVQHDSLEIDSGSGRIIDITFDGAGDITAIRLDSTVPVRITTDLLSVADLFAEPDLMALGARTGARIRRATENTVHELTGASGDTDTLTFAAPIDPTGISIGALVAVGPFSREVKRLIASDMTPEPDLIFAISAVDEAPGVVPDLSI